MQRRPVRRRCGRSRRDQADFEPTLADLGAPDGGTRLRAAHALQARLGNAAVQELLHATSAPRARRGVTGQETLADDGGGGGNVPLGATGGGASGTTFTVSNATENRDEETLNDVATTLSSRTEAGSTQPSFGTISTSLDANSKVTSASVTITETVTLPKWTKRDAACDRHKAEWDRFLAALTKHEQGHVAIDRKYFENITSKLIGLKDEDVDAKVDAIKAQAQTENDTYDTGNGHGVNDGTSIDAGIRCTDKVD